jgi:D-sedoheptulose 7-phosphate isomerase
MKTEEKIKQAINGNIATQEKVLIKLVPQIAKVAQLMIKAVKKGGQIITFGNGGSAADSQHLVAELIGRFKLERKAIKAVSLTTNTSTITALANDYSFDFIFSRQIEALACKNDLAIGISTSGNSLNVINAIVKANALGIATVVLSGGGGGRLSKIAKASLIVPSTDTPRIQEAHILIIHILCQLVEEGLFKN